MAKLKRTRAPSSYRRRKRSQRAARWLPWIAGGAALLVIVFVAGRALLAPNSPGKGYRTEEWLGGVSGVSYDAGPTEQTYPDPAGLGEGSQWLPALGDEDAPVVVMEFSDIFCGHCRDYNLDSLQGIIDDYVATGQVRYVDHFFGFAGSFQQGIPHAEMCAAEQGRYFEFKHALFQTLEAGAFDVARAVRIAGLDTSGFDACQEEQRYMSAVQEMLLEDTSGVQSTPTFIVNGKMIIGNVPDRIRQAIEAALNEEN